MRRLTASVTASLLTALGLLPFTTGAQPDSWNVEGAHGELHVYGEFVEGSCRVDMVSQTQEIDLGEISTQALRRVGDRGEPIAFTIRLRNCVRTGGHMLNARSGNAVWDPIQPVASITFLAPADADSPQLVQVKGVTGLGLRITDGGGRDVYLGDRSAPQFVTPASDALVYHVQPERTPAPLTPGKWQATVGFRLNYD